MKINLASTSGNKITKIDPNKLRKKAFEERQNYLVPGFVADKRDVIFWGGAGSGKTYLTLMMIWAMVEQRFFGDSDEPCPAFPKKVLFIAADGGISAVGIIGEYLANLGVLDSEHLDNKIVFWGADEDDGIPSWNLRTGNLIRLQRELESGEYGLVVIDSLKAVCSNTHWSIDDRSIGDVMRLVQNVVCKKAALVWIHHTNKSRSENSDKSAGVTDIVELTSGNIQFKKERDQNLGKTRSSIIVHKLRGQSDRSFYYKFSPTEITVEGQSTSNPETFNPSMKKLLNMKTDLPQAIITAISKSDFNRLSRQSLAERLNQPDPRTLDYSIKELKKEGLVDSRSNALALTKKGSELAPNLGSNAYITYARTPADSQV
jgi:RecA-family ATPase